MPKIQHLGFVALLVAGLGGTSPASADSTSQTEGSTKTAIHQQSGSRGIDDIAHQAMTQYHLKAIIVEVNLGGRQIYRKALGESMTGVAATPAMHFRNGAMAFTYISTLLLETVDQNRVVLTDKLSKWLPKLPDADRISLKNLANMTSGYADYVYQPEVLQGLSRDPFRQWTSEELIGIGISKPMMFEPGTNWGYSHTNYVILGRVLEMVTRMKLAAAIQHYVFGPLSLHQTQAFDTPQVPEPVMHSFSSERREDLGIPPGIPFYEESTFWDPSWTTAEGAVETTDIDDFAKSIEAAGTGKLLSHRSFIEQTAPNLVGFGHKDPHCPVCATLTDAGNYGLGVVNLGPWVTQTKNFAGNGATAGYLASQHLTVAVVTSYMPAAFDEKGGYTNASTAIFALIGNLFARGTITSPGK
jgi:CubicO group peptidase (beta-lactamase class C family)